MEMFFSAEERYKYRKKNWLDEVYSHGVSLIRRFEYLPLKSEFIIEFFDPEDSDSKFTILFQKVTAFLDTTHDLEVSDESYEYNETEDPIDFLESEKEGITEYFIFTNARELTWKTTEIPKIERL